MVVVVVVAAVLRADGCTCVCVKLCWHKAGCSLLIDSSSTVARMRLCAQHKGRGLLSGEDRHRGSRWTWVVGAAALRPT
jgi:hypothetical protein